MSVEKSLGVRLDLMVNFASASREAVQSITAIGNGIEALKTLGGRISMPGLDELAQTINGLTQRVSTSTQRVSEMGVAVEQTATKTRRAKQSVDTATQSVNDLGKAAQQSQAAILRLGTSMTQLGNAIIVVDKVGNAFTGITAEAVRAKRAVDELEASLMRLQSTAPRISLGSGMRDSQGFTQVLPPGRTPIVTPSYVTPMAALGSGSNARYALPPSYGSNYGPIPQPAWRSRATAALSASEMLALSGGTEPNFNARSWWANQRSNNPGASGSGPPIGVPPGGFGGGGRGFGFNGGWWGGVGKSGEGISRFGNDLQSGGYASAVNAAILGGWMVPTVKGGAATEDLMFRNREAIVSAGGSRQQANQFNTSAMDIAAKTGSPFDQTVGAVYDFVSASPENLTAQYGKNPQVQQALIKAYGRVAQLQVAGSSSQHQISMEESSLDVNNLIANLGFDTSTPKKYSQAIKDATNILINLKNRTSTQVDLAASSFRAIGPIATQSDMSPDEVVGWVAAMAAGKIRGAPAGQGLKRVLMRQSMPVKKVQELQAFASKMTGGRDTLSIFDKGGKMKSLGRLGQEVVDFEDRNKLNDKQRAGLAGELAGLYALPQMGLFLKSVRSFTHDPKGAAHGFQAFGKSFRTGKVGGMDATEGSFKQRTDGNTQNAMDRTANDLLRERQKLFRDMEPELLAVLKDVDGLVTWFDHLSTGTKKFLVNGIALMAAASAVSGIFAILGGNTIKLVGGLLRLGAGAVQMAAVVSSGQKLAALGPIANGAAMGIRALGLAMMANPIGLIIGGIAIAIGLLALAWSHNWFDIQGKTHAAVAFLNKELTSLVNWVKNVVNEAGSWFKKFAPQIEDGLTMAFPIFAAFNPRFRDAGLKLVEFIGNGIKNGAHFVVDEVKHIGAELWDGVKSWTSAGAGAVKNFINGIDSATPGAVEASKKMAQKVRDIHPGSEPKDSSSPFTDMARSGRALVTNFTDGIIAATPGAVQVAMDSTQQVRDGVDAIIAGKGARGKGKGKKAKQPVADTLIDLRPGETIAKIQRDALLIEAALERAGAVVRKKWIDIRQGMSITRVYGNPAAYHKAVTQNGSADPMLAASRDYMLNLKRFPHTFEQNMSNLNNMLLQSTSSHTRAVINGMIGTLMAQHTKAMEAYAKKLATWAGGQDGHGGLMGKFNTEFGRIGSGSQKFADTSAAGDDKLQQAVYARKNQEIPTLKELQRERNIEITQRKELLTIYHQEESERDKILTQINTLVARASGLNDTDAKSVLLKKQLYAQANALWGQLTLVNHALLEQDNTIQHLNGTVDGYTQAVIDAANKNKAFADILSESFAKAGQDAMNKLGAVLNNGLDTMFSKVFGAKRGGIIGFIGQFFTDAFDNAFGTVTNNLMGKMSSNLSSSMGNLFTNMFHLGTSTAPGSQQTSKVTLTDSSGSDVTQDIHDALQTTAGNTAQLPQVAGGIDTIAKGMTSVAAAAQATGGKKSKSTADVSVDGSSDPLSAAIDKMLKSKTGKIIQGIAGAFAGYETATQPGSGGAFQNILGAGETYASVAGMFSGGAASAGGAGPYVAAAVALYELFSHHDNPVNMPDKYDTARFTTDIGELQGSASTGYGPAYNPVTDPIQQQLGGKSMLSYIEQWVAQNINSKDAATKALAQNLMGQFGTSGNGQLSFDHNLNQETVVGGSLHGSYTDLHNAAENAITSITKMSDAASQAALQQQQNADRLAASFTSIIFGGPSGFFIPYGATGGGGSTGSVLAGGSSGGSGGNGQPGSRRGEPGLLPLPSGGTLPHQHPVTIDLSNMKVDAATLPDLQKMLNSAIPDLVQAVRQADYNDSRLYGNYTSAIQ